MKYRAYSAEELANDSFFIRWVRHPDAESDWFWTSFVRENPKCLPQVEAAREMIALLGSESHLLEEQEMNSMRDGLLMALHAEKEDHRERMSVRSLRVTRPNRFWYRIAAAFLILALALPGAYIFKGTPHAGEKVAGAPDELEQRANPAGQKSVLFLSDGTKVWLNAASRISYVKDFNGQPTRDVYLEGEAFFDVAHDREKQFIVHTSSIQIAVLGTSFNVKSYPDEKTIETTLVKGKVRIQRSGTKGKLIGDLELNPNQRAIFDKESDIINIREVVAENSGTWKEERLVFDGESMDNVFLQMERWYDVRIHVENRGNLHCKLTASIEKESLEEVLKLIEASHEIRYVISGKDVFIEGELCDGP